MIAEDFAALFPIIMLSAVAVLVMLEIAVRRSHTVAAVTTCVGLVATICSFAFVSDVVPRQVTPLLIMDGYSVFFMLLVLATALVVTLLSYSYLSYRSGQNEEYYLILLLATLGAMVLSASTHFASFFIGLEILSVSLYALVAYTRKQWRSIEAGIKYLILSGASDAFLLFGMALVYSQTGELRFAGIAQSALLGSPAIMAVASCLLATGIGFKLSLVPFHLWTPDVYEGAPVPVTGFLATASKAAVFAVLFRYYLIIDVNAHAGLQTILTILAAASMIAGNLLALLQPNVKRILAYSSIAHMGYVLVALLAGSTLGVQAAGYYLVAYCVTTIGAFGAISVFSTGERDLDRLDDYGGLGWSRPWVGGVLAAMLLSLAGIPLTGGFIGKFYVLTAGVGSSLWWLVLILVLTSAIGLFYYLRIIITLYSSPKSGQIPLPAKPSFVDNVVLALLAILLVWLGVWPLSLMRFMEMTVLAGL
jgi:NADH-quinone oxidoreductase subunit N